MWKSFPLVGISDSSEMQDLAGMEKETVKRDSCENKENISTIFSRNKLHFFLMIDTDKHTHDR